MTPQTPIGKERSVAELAGRVAVVTGGSRGIGRAIAVSFAKAGAHVAGCARRAEGGSFLDDLNPEQRKACRFLACDVRVGEQVNRFRDQVEAAFGPADVLVNNAGIVARASVVSLSEDTWNDVLASNLTGTFLVTRAFLPAMKSRRGGGRIINVSSIAGRTGTPMLSAYCAAKHGVVGFTRALAEELRGDGIVVNAICPGSVDTEMLGQGMPGATPKMTTDEVAAVALFLATAAPAALTGACIDVFG
jgi:NAD(P)-dependent dehydrogenase (short-subunit alcohol dehydrogenase family)